MRIIAKLFTLLRGKSHEAGQAVVDANAMTILDQEMRDADKNLATSRSELTKIMGRSNLLQVEIETRAIKINEYSTTIQKLLEKGDQALAVEVAEKVAELEAQQATATTQKQVIDKTIANLKTTIKTTETRIRSMRSQIDQVKATAAVQKAQLAITANVNNSNGGVSSALQSLERLKERQAEAGARIAAGQELEELGTDADLQRRLEQAGVSHGSTNAADVLARFTKPTPQLTHEEPIRLIGQRIESPEAAGTGSVS